MANFISRCFSTPKIHLKSMSTDEEDSNAKIEVWSGTPKCSKVLIASSRKYVTEKKFSS